MSDHSFGTLATGAGSTTLPMVSLYSDADTGFILREVAIYNNTAVAVDICLRRFSTIGTPGAAIDEIDWDDDRSPHGAIASQAHSSTPPTVLAGFIRRIVLPGIIGAGVTWTFGGGGFHVREGTGNGVGVLPGAGTGQICVVEMVWEE